MKAREQARFDMVKRVSTFGTNNAADLNGPPPLTPGQTQAKQLFADLSTASTGLIARIDKTAQNQATGTGELRGGTTSKTVLRDALLLELRGINRSAAAIAEAQGKPQIMDQFRMPYGVGDTILVARANAMGDAAQAMSGDFILLGHDPAFVTDLRAHAAALPQADAGQDSGEQKQSGATASFEPLLAEAMMKVKQLDAFMHNFYRTNAEKMGEWKTASHVERQAKKKTPPANPTNP